MALEKAITPSSRVFGVTNGRLIAKTKSSCINSLRVSIKKAKGVPKGTICLKCGVLFPSMGSNNCNDCENIDKGIPESLILLYCQSCDGFSFSPRTDFDFVSSPPNPNVIIRFLTRSLLPNVNRLQQRLIDAYFILWRFGPNESKLVLQLERKTVHGQILFNRHVLLCKVTHKTCHCCSFNKRTPASDGDHIVHISRPLSDRRNISRALFRILRQGDVALDKVYKVKTNDMDFYCSSEKDATTFYQLLCSQFPVKPEGHKGYYSALVCPISHEDLVKVRTSSSKCLMICTKLTNSIFLLDPLTLEEKTVSAAEYWSDPTMLKTRKDQWDIVEYVVLFMENIQEKGAYTIADVVVARVSDYGKNNTVFKTRTHLGEYLKPFDQVYGYDLSDPRNTLYCKQFNSSVILIRKGSFSDSIRRKNSGPEYEKFLNDLEKNPEAMLKLSLNNDNPSDNLDFDLEELLSGLVLGDRQVGDTSDRHCTK